MAFYQDTHIFSQGGELSQLTGGFTSQKEREVDREELGLIDPDTAGQDETMSTRAEAICEENRQINRFVELNLKQLERKRLKLIKEDKELDEEKAKLEENKKRQSEQNLELQMNLEECSLAYMNELKERNKVVDKLKQVEDFINTCELNVAKGKTLGESTEETKQWLEAEFDEIKKESKTIQEKNTRMMASCIAKLEENAKKCKELKDTMMKDGEDMVNEIQTLALKNEEIHDKIKELQEEINKIKQNNNDEIESYNSILVEHKLLNEGIAKMYQEINESKTISAARIQHLKLQINSEENINRNLETSLKEKEELMQSLTSKWKELTSLLKQLKEAVNGAEKQVEKKLKEIKMYEEKKPVLDDQIRTLLETLKKYHNVENENKHYKDSIISLEEEIKLNTINLTKIENKVSELDNVITSLEDKLSDLKQSKTESDKKLEESQSIKNKLSSGVQENKILYQQERESQLLEKETLKQTNATISAEIEECTLKLQELCSFDENAKVKKEELKRLIESCKKTVELNEEKLSKDKEDQVKTVENYSKIIEDIKMNLDKNESFIVERKPAQRELPVMLEKKESLEHSIKLLEENHQKMIISLESSHRAKIQEMDSEMEKHSSIMENIQSDQRESTNKLIEEIKEEEKIKISNETELRVLYQKLMSLKNEEVLKRNKIVKMEKRQQAIMKEIKVSREDIAQAVAGKAQVPNPMRSSACKEKALSIASSSQSLVGRASTSKQESTRKWIESVPEDDYEFSEI